MAFDIKGGAPAPTSERELLQDFGLERRGLLER